MGNYAVISWLAKFYLEVPYLVNPISNLSKYRYNIFMTS